MCAVIQDLHSHSALPALQDLWSSQLWVQTRCSWAGRNLANPTGTSWATWLPVNSCTVEVRHHFIFFLTFDISELWIHINVHSSHNCNNQKQPLFFSILVKTLFLVSLQEIFVPSRWMATLQLLWLCLTWKKTCHTNSKFKPRPRRALDQSEKASSPSNPKMEVCWTLQQCDRESDMIVCAFLWYVSHC